MNDDESHGPCQDPPNTLYVDVPDHLLEYETFGVHVARSGCVMVLPADFSKFGIPEPKDPGDEPLRRARELLETKPEGWRAIQGQVHVIDGEGALVAMVPKQRKSFVPLIAESPTLLEALCDKVEAQEKKLQQLQRALEIENLDTVLAEIADKDKRITELERQVRSVHLVMLPQGCSCPVCIDR